MLRKEKLPKKNGEPPLVKKRIEVCGGIRQKRSKAKRIKKEDLQVKKTYRKTLQWGKRADGSLEREEVGTGPSREKEKAEETGIQWVQKDSGG